MLGKSEKAPNGWLHGPVLPGRSTGTCSHTCLAEAIEHKLWSSVCQLERSSIARLPNAGWIWDRNATSVSLAFRSRGRSESLGSPVNQSVHQLRHLPACACHRIHATNAASRISFATLTSHMYAWSGSGRCKPHTLWKSERICRRQGPYWRHGVNPRFSWLS